MCVCVCVCVLSGLFFGGDGGKGSEGGGVVQPPTCTTAIIRERTHTGSVPESLWIGET